MLRMYVKMDHNNKKTKTNRGRCESRGQLVFERLKENSIGFPGGSSQWFIALLPGRVCRSGTAAIWKEKKDMLRGKGSYRALRRPREKTKRLRPPSCSCNFLWSKTLHDTTQDFIFIQFNIVERSVRCSCNLLGFSSSCVVAPQVTFFF